MKNFCKRLLYLLMLAVQAAWAGTAEKTFVVLSDTHVMAWMASPVRGEFTQKCEFPCIIQILFVTLGPNK